MGYFLACSWYLNVCVDADQSQNHCQMDLHFYSTFPVHRPLKSALHRLSHSHTVIHRIWNSNLPISRQPALLPELHEPQHWEKTLKSIDTAFQGKQASSTTKCHLLFSKEAVVVTEVYQRLLIESKAGDAISHCKALKTKCTQYNHTALMQMSFPEG